MFWNYLLFSFCFPNFSEIFLCTLEIVIFDDDVEQISNTTKSQMRWWKYIWTMDWLYNFMLLAIC